MDLSLSGMDRHTWTIGQKLGNFIHMDDVHNLDDNAWKYLMVNQVFDVNGLVNHEHAGLTTL